MLKDRLRDVEADMTKILEIIWANKKRNKITWDGIYDRWFELSSEQTSISEEIKWSTDMFEKITKY